MSCAPVPKLSWWISTALTPVHQCLSYVWEPKTGHGTQDIVTEVIEKNEHFAWTVCYSLANTSQHLFDLHCHWQSFSTWSPQGPAGPFLQSCLLPVAAQPVQLHGITSFQVQDSAFAFAELREGTSKPFFQLTLVLLNGSTALQYTYCSSQFLTWVFMAMLIIKY